MFKNMLSTLTLITLVLTATSSHAANPHDFDYSKIDLADSVLRRKNWKETVDYKLEDTGIRGFNEPEKRLLKSLEDAVELKMVSNLYASKSPGNEYDQIYVFIGKRPDGDFEFVRCFQVAKLMKTANYDNYCEQDPIRDVKDEIFTYVHENQFEAVVKRDRSALFRK